MHIVFCCTENVRCDHSFKGKEDPVVMVKWKRHFHLVVFRHKKIYVLISYKRNI